MKNYIENSELSITYIYIGEVQTSEFNNDQEFSTACIYIKKLYGNS
jgi:hypothetical protein